MYTRVWVFNCLLYLVAIVPPGCGTENVAASKTELSSKEEARVELDADNFAKAIELYLVAIEEDPEDYSLYRFLAAAYAGLGGFSAVDALSPGGDQSNGDNSEGGLGQLDALVPAAPTAEQVNALASARDTLLAMPAAYRDANNSEIEDAASAAIQLTLYQTAYAIAYMNQFKVANSDGFDPEKLANMSPEDAAAIIGALAGAAEATGSEGLGAGVAEILTEIESSEGENDRDRLVSYLESQ